MIFAASTLLGQGRKKELPPEPAAIRSAADGADIGSVRSACAEPAAGADAAAALHIAAHQEKRTSYDSPSNPQHPFSLGPKRGRHEVDHLVCRGTRDSEKFVWSNP